MTVHVVALMTNHVVNAHSVVKIVHVASSIQIVRWFEDRPRREFNSDRPKVVSTINRFDSNDDNRGNVNYKPRRENGFGDRPKRTFGGEDRPRRSFDDKPRGERPSFGGEDRPRREFNSDRPRREGGFNDKPRRSFDDKPRGERPFVVVQNVASVVKIVRVVALTNRVDQSIVCLKGRYTGLSYFQFL